MNFAVAWIVAFLVIVKNQVFKAIILIYLMNDFLKDVSVELFKDGIIFNLFEIY